ncbi:hypothetical protein SJ_194 [Proteus phage SJ_PmiM]|nr:hypothetical protein SJ_194 [Proteus phage SJ_PmiM]
MSLLKNTKNFFSTKLNFFFKSNLSAEERYTQAATVIINKIDELRHAEITATQSIAHLKEKSKDHFKNSKLKEDHILLLKSKNQPVPKAYFIAALQYKKLGEALEAEVENRKKSIMVIAEKVVELADKAEEIKANLEVIKLNKETDALGIKLPEDITASTDHVLVDVDTIISEVDTFTESSNVTLNMSELELYVNTFNK